MTGLLAMAFATGMLAPVNPCGFALLPAYLAYQPIADGGQGGGTTARLIGGLRCGIAVTAGFAAVFTLAGLAVTAGLRTLLTVAPWLGLAVGLALIAAGGWMVAGRSLPALRLPGLARRTPAAGASSGSGSLVVFGAGYAIASLSCTLAILLAVIAQALATGSTTGVIGVFAAYTLGAATLLILVSVTAALTGGALTSRIKRLLPAVPRIAAVVLILAGLYLITYWAPVALTGQPAASPLAAAITAIARPASAFIAEHQTLIVWAAVAAVASAVIAVLLRRTRAARTPQPDSASHIQVAQPDAAHGERPPCC